MKGFLLITLLSVVFLTTVEGCGNDSSSSEESRESDEILAIAGGNTAGDNGHVNGGEVPIDSTLNDTFSLTDEKETSTHDPAILSSDQLLAITMHMEASQDNSTTLEQMTATNNTSIPTPGETAQAHASSIPTTEKTTSTQHQNTTTPVQTTSTQNQHTTEQTTSAQNQHTSEQTTSAQHEHQTTTVPTSTAQTQPTNGTTEVSNTTAPHAVIGLPNPASDPSVPGLDKIIALLDSQIAVLPAPTQPEPADDAPETCRKNFGFCQPTKLLCLAQTVKNFCQTGSRCCVFTPKDDKECHQKAGVCKDIYYHKCGGNFTMGSCSGDSRRQCCI